ncbi:MAG TPA: LysR family transcriptional regulator [Stellaceae bacterium]|nr:LysR family transcriptional regulator [Stellaceae bacterium]
MTNIDRWLRLFLVIARSGSVSRAAEELDLTQSGLSRQLASLEAYLSHPLFERHGRGVQLTDAGKKLEQATRSAYALIDDTVFQLRRQEGVTEGTLRVATIHTLGPYFISPVFAQYMTQLPRVNLSMLGRSSPGVVDMVESGKADIGFVYDVAVATDALDIVPLFDETMSLIVHEGSSLAGESSVDLTARAIPLVVFPPEFALRRMLETSGLGFEVAAEVETVENMLQLVSMTRGHCILPERVPSEILRNHGLLRIQIARPHLSRRVVAITRHDRPPTALTRLMLEIAQSVAGQLARNS